MTARLCSYATGCKHVIHCRGCGQTWTEDANLDDSRCGCTCADPTTTDYEDWTIHPAECAVIDISSSGFHFRGAPVTLVSNGVAALLHRCGEDIEIGVGLILCTATDVESSGCILQSDAVGGVPVLIERFDCTFEQGRHEGGRWSVFLPSER